MKSPLLDALEKMCRLRRKCLGSRCMIAEVPQSVVGIASSIQALFCVLATTIDFDSGTGG
ncbi:hypothetical protein C8Q77DRAFT_1138912 [Trametes polyzona]|nr:hypothetical protein C8Q77DRAFT_1138912 [Trametes polyzona]